MQDGSMVEDGSERSYLQEKIGCSGLLLQKNRKMKA